VHLQQPLKPDEVQQLREDFDFVVIATGAQKPRMLPVPGNERAVTALEFLKLAKANKAKVGKHVVIIGAGNVGCDAAAEAHRFGGRVITMLDVQEPASFGKEREAAVAVGATFKWPVFTEEITAKSVKLTDGEEIAADTVIISIWIFCLRPSLKKKGLSKLMTAIRPTTPRFLPSAMWSGRGS